MPRRRASKACLHCRQRKVRCDVTLRGVPCLNCQLDHQSCAVQERKSKRTLSNSKSSFHKQGGSIIEGLSTGRMNDNPSGIDSIDQWAKRLSALTPVSLRGSPVATFNASHQDANSSESQCINLEGFSPRTAFTISKLHTSSLKAEKSSACDTFADQSTAAVYNNFESLPFIRPPDLAHVSALDIRFMQLNGCFDLPPMPILNEFVRIYFLHVHPIIPLFDEGEFWDSYSCTNEKRISLLVFQAIIFAACAILYDFEIECDPISLGQAALLFTFWPGSLRPGPSKQNSQWLSKAIGHAKSLRAHHLTSNTGRDKLPDIPPRTRISLRRLWWCCYIRDRIIALGLRRTLRIPEKYPTLDIEDFEDEIHRSRVYKAESKRCFFDIFMRISKLCVVVTDLLRLCSVSEHGLECETNITVTDRQEAVASCTAQLQEWYDSARQQFPDDAEQPGIRPHFVIIQTNLMFTYYFAAKLAIFHQEIFYAVRDSENANGEGPYPALADKSDQVRDAVDNVIKHLANPVRLGLAQYLPISVVAFVAMPLMMQIINAKIMARGVANARAEVHRQQLHSLISLIKQCHPRLDGIDAVCVTIRRLTDLAQARFMSGNASQITECLDLIDRKPLEYLRLFLNLDLNLSNATMLDNIEFLELREELLRINKYSSEADAQQSPSATEGTKASSTPTGPDACDRDLPEAKADAPGDIDDSFLDIDQLLGGDGLLEADPAFMALEPHFMMNQQMEWEMDAWLLGET
ncbi:N-terminal binuclear Zn cluster-containing/DNA binding domain-containing protein [Trichoderma citrinoviride]|uniref:N-terminal binuclear Zn cluster-containing/DNA binding domain-containing protein n=1 Tax=Trichoderma citrinoviride TaxID=58853 RepID=A0A2T4B056_9HYPO|nr:N-terminal binuclear Zn cluster-containing/DNA binding domain-containing protein [Trichoderma citrinoviride]PTB62707.1 N-terminal binuclear Zn cluster-containing/DNA binding domain-containing protein [Trichoderma citrinoviride]